MGGSICFGLRTPEGKESFYDTWTNWISWAMHTPAFQAGHTDLTGGRRNPIMTTEYGLLLLDLKGGVIYSDNHYTSGNEGQVSYMSSAFADELTGLYGLMQREVKPRCYVPFYISKERLKPLNGLLGKRLMDMRTGGTKAGKRFAKGTTLKTEGLAALLQDKARGLHYSTDTHSFATPEETEEFARRMRPHLDGITLKVETTLRYYQPDTLYSAPELADAPLVGSPLPPPEGEEDDRGEDGWRAGERALRLAHFLRFFGWSASVPSVSEHGFFRKPHPDYRP